MTELLSLPSELIQEICLYLTPQQILTSCSVNKSTINLFNEEFWYQHVQKTYNPDDFGLNIDIIDDNTLKYFNAESWSDFAKLSFVKKRLSGKINNKDTSFNLELNFFSTPLDILDQIEEYFDNSSDGCCADYRYLLLRLYGKISHSNDKEESACAIIFRSGSSYQYDFGLTYKFSSIGPEVYEDIDQNSIPPDVNITENIPIGKLKILNKNFFTNITRYELSITFRDRQYFPTSGCIKFVPPQGKCNILGQMDILHTYIPDSKDIPWKDRMFSYFPYLGVGLPQMMVRLINIFS
jgi:hypothetical protein